MAAPQSGNRAPSKDSGASRPNTINLKLPALSIFLDKLDEPEKNGASNKRRGFLRTAFRREAVELTLSHPGGTDVSVKVACRNLSSGGISILHNCFVHPGSRCSVRLPKADGTVVSLAGVVKRCIHRAGIVHEVGIAFDSRVLPREFVADDPFTNAFSLEKVDPTQLQGSLLLVDPSPTSRGVVRHYLRDTAVVVEEVAAGAAAPALAQAADVVLVTADLPDLSFPAFAQSVRQSGFAGALIVIVNDTSAATRLRVGPGRPTIVLQQPLSQILLHRALAEVLLVERAVAGIGGTSTERARTDLAQAGDALSAAAISGSCIHCGHALKRIGDVAEVSGWKPIANAARQLSGELKAANAVQPLAPAIQALVQACVLQAAA